MRRPSTHIAADGARSRRGGVLALSWVTVFGAGRSWFLLAALLACAAAARAQDMPGAVLELAFTPAPRAQIAIWIEDTNGRFLRTLELTEAVAFRGLGNRPGASQMNSGYRWPYGRREGVLPIWASRRAASPSATQWKRVIFQNRTYEGLASRTSADQSPDNYFCLSFNQATTSRSALDAVSCASVFTSDKGRFITAADVSAGYHEPFENPATHVGTAAPLPLQSLYPPRMDVRRCTDSACYDHADVASYAEHARSVMPEIDAVTLATPPGNTKQNLLFSLPMSWPKGQYVLWFEINVEGDYNSTYSATTFATPTQPSNEWDSWAVSYGYPYRGQPSIAFKLPFELADIGEADQVASQPEGCSSWDFWQAGYGAMAPVTDISDDPAGAADSGADRLRRDSNGDRLALHVRTLMALPESDPTEPPPIEVFSGTKSSSSGGGQSGTTPPPASGSGGASMPAATDPTGMPSMGSKSSTPDPMQPDSQSDAVILAPEQGTDSSVGPIRELHLGHHPARLHAHEWITLSFLAATSQQPLHAYEVRISTSPIFDEASFIRDGRPAKTASEDEEGAVSLMLPAEVEAGHLVKGEIGDLVAETHYYVAVRATDTLDRHGPISVAQITTQKRAFATVTPCFVATAAYGSSLAEQVGVLRRLRDRQLMSNAVGRTLVRAYYAVGGALAGELRAHEPMRRAARALLEPAVALARHFESAE
jgi:hypothetical protein